MEKEKELDYTMTPKEWQEMVKARAKAIGKSEDWVIRHGLYAEPKRGA